ncbi:MAG TPA: chromosome segregation protein SMC [Aquella sp.]|nr:chromosome segregation protein SMC [Aquella sp.]
MRLSHIKLSGFKSFVEHTTIEVKGDRVAVVGPNGCGKSNVIDAVRWVLGESSAKQLRGESMHDVIFNGSTKRKAVSRATVELVFDNSEKGLSGLWNTYDEVSIKRLISRSGDSVYYINNQVVRRRDITELFLGTGVGTKGYAVIEQGMISKIIESKPEELRQFLEEAAGVSKYREKRKEAIARLQDTKENLVRLEDIQGQLVKQIETLQIQATDAKRYQDLQTELKTTGLTTILLKMDKARQSLTEIDTGVAKSEKELAALAQGLAMEEEQLLQNQSDQSEQEAKLNEITFAFNAKRTHLARLEERKAHQQELTERLARDYNDLLMQNDELHLQVEDLNLQISELEELITANTLEVEGLQLEKQEKSASFALAGQKYQKANQTVENISAQTVDAKHNLELLNNTREHKKTQYNNLLNRQKKQEQEMHGLDFNQGYFTLQEQIEGLNTELKQLEEQLAVDKTKLIDYRQTYEQSAKGLAQIQNEQISIKSKIATLEELVAQVIPDPTQVIPDPDRGSILYQSLEVKAGYEIATQIALGNILSAVIIDNLEQIKNIPDSMFSAWLNNDANVYKARPNTLANFIKLKSDGLSQIYNILNDYIVADNFNQALELLPIISAGQKIVTLDGHLLNNNFVVFNANTTDNHVLEYQNQLISLKTNADELTVKFDIADEELSHLQVQIEEVSAEANQVENLIKERGQLRHKLQLEFTTHEQIYIQTKNHHEKIKQELELLVKEMLYLQDELTEIEIKIKEQQTTVDDLQLKSTDTNLSKLEHETLYNLAKSSLEEIDNKVNQKIIDNQLLGQKMTILHKNLEDKTLQINSLSERRLKLTQDREGIEEEQQTNEAEELSKQIGDVASTIEEQNKELVQLSNKTAASRNKINEFHQTKDKLQEKLNSLRLKEQEQLLFLHNQQELLDNLQMPDYDKEQILAQNQNTLQELQSKMTKLQQQIEELGLVNLKAIEDLEQINAKNSSLVDQVSDLTDGMHQLEGAIGQIDQETRLLMNNTYTKVCDSFSVYFKTLFGGGNATLELTENDILNSGIQIFVQPPGKKNSSIHLLSGGEKALSAISLIFALFNLNPAPFCLLDEVDAPLDDANTARFCNLVQELSNSTQFIFISHNRLTMEMADQLVGVTMQEQGVSTTVSVSLSEAVAAAS